MIFFPDDILSDIFSHFHKPRDLSSVSRVCKRWKDIVEKPDGLWRDMCFYYMGKTEPLPLNGSWKKRVHAFFNWQKGKSLTQFFKRKTSIDEFSFFLPREPLIEASYFLPFDEQNRDLQLKVALLDLISGQQRTTQQEIDQEQIFCHAYNKNLMITGDAKGVIRIFDAATGDLKGKIVETHRTLFSVQEPERTFIRSLACTDAWLVSTSNGGEVKIWSLKTGELNATLQANVHYINYLYCNNKQIVYWGLSQDNRVTSLFYHCFNHISAEKVVKEGDSITTPIESSPVALDGSILAGITNKSILKIWNSDQLDVGPVEEQPIPKAEKNVFDKIKQVGLILHHPHVILYQNIQSEKQGTYSFMCCYNWRSQKWLFSEKYAFLIRSLHATADRLIVNGGNDLAILNFNQTNLLMNASLFSFADGLRKRVDTLLTPESDKRKRKLKFP